MNDIRVFLDLHDGILNFPVMKVHADFIADLELPVV
jgi:hypothetical protein